MVTTYFFYAAMDLSSGLPKKCQIFHLYLQQVADEIVFFIFVGQFVSIKMLLMSTMTLETWFIFLRSVGIGNVNILGQSANLNRSSRRTMIIRGLLNFDGPYCSRCMPRIEFRG